MISVSALADSVRARKGAGPPVLTKLFVMHVVEAAAGGVRRHVIDLVRGLARLGFRQTVLYSPAGADEGFRRGIAELQSDVTFTPFPLRHQVSLADAVATFRLWRECRRNRPDVIHLHSSKAGGVGRLAAVLGTPGSLVYTPHAAASHVGWYYAVIERFLGHVVPATVLAVSPSEHSELGRLRIAPPSRLRCIPNGIDPDEVVRLAREGTGVQVQVDVAVCGRITRQKDPMTIAAASAEVIRVRPNTRFRWIGDGDMRAQFEGALVRAGVRESWEITGWVQNPYPYVAASRLLWLASLYESFGYVTLEGMVLGVPTIGSRVTGTADLIVDGESGFFFQVGDAATLADRTRDYLANAQLRDRMSHAARTRSTSFLSSEMIRQTARLYESLSKGTGL